jgi:predicted transcriptional regulator
MAYNYDTKKHEFSEEEMKAITTAVHIAHAVNNTLIARDVVFTQSWLAERDKEYTLAKDAIYDRFNDRKAAEVEAEAEAE